MVQHFCGVKRDGIYDTSLTPEFQLNNNGDIIATGLTDMPYRWNKKTITYKLVNSTGDIPNTHLQAEALNYAITHWALYIPIKFKRVYGDTTPADVIVKFDGTDKYFTSDGILAYTWLPHPQNPLSGNMTFNDSKTLRWSLDGKPINAHLADPAQYPDPNTPVTFQTINIVQTLTHEFGHALGLQHQDNTPTCIMYPYYHDDYDFCIGEITKLQSLYGTRNLNPSFIESFMNALKRVFPIP